MVPNSSKLNPWDYQVWVQCWSLSQAASQHSSEFEDALQLIWSALPEKAIDNAVKDFRKRLQASVPASSRPIHFEHNYSVILRIRDTNSCI